MEKFKKVIIKIGIFALILILMKQFIPSLKLDGYSGLIWNTILLTDDTKYSENYDERKFLEIKIGMSKNQVYRILGKPIHIFSPEENITSLQYSKSPKDTHYRIRQVYLRNDKVVDIISYFYVD